jgi:hypothetical protein
VRGGKVCNALRRARRWRLFSAREGRKCGGDAMGDSAWI